MRRVAWPHLQKIGYNTLMKIDLHNHTVRCNHATGTVDEYIQRAIELGIDVYGFSEHAPMDFDEGYRVSFEEMHAYEADILEAKKKYADRIDIRLGYEVDWLPGHMDKRVLEAEVDFLIGSVHFIDKWGFDNPEFIGEWEGKDIVKVWQDYFDAVQDMAESGLFDIAGHLDLIKVFGHMPDVNIRSMAHPALKAIKKADMVLELNTAGLRKQVSEIYPSREILQEAFALDIPVTFGSDAHASEQVGDRLELAYELAKSVGYSQAATFRSRQRQMVKI
jgi:histidinol-phosphatase (PHP family)